MTGRPYHSTPPSHHILVVDDEPHLREVLGDALSENGRQVSLASSGKDALRIATQTPPDLVVADFRLGDCTGLEVIDDIRRLGGLTPAVVITGHRDAATLTEASRHHVAEVMVKPLDVERLRKTVRQELTRLDLSRLARRRSLRLRDLARQANHERKEAQARLDSTCSDLTTAYRSLSAQLALQQIVIGYQQQLLGARTDDDVFRTLFGLFVRRSGSVNGVALVCDANAELQVAGRFGVPLPDDLRFCSLLVKPVIGQVLARPECMIMDAGEEIDLFEPSIRKFLPGLSILAMPLIPSEGELIGMVVFYRKGEQPFSKDDLTLSQLLSPPTAVVVRRND